MRPPKAPAARLPAKPAKRPAAAAPAMAADRVYEAIYGAIVDHRLPAGTRLREEELAQTFAVSRTLVRQALHRLAQDGVVLLRPNRGAQVPEPTREEGANVFDARRVVECEVARRLVGKLNAAQRQALGSIVDAEAEAIAAGDQREAVRLSGAFHVELARLSGNPLFVRMLEELLPTTSLLMSLYKAPGEPMCVAHSHRALLAVLDGGSRAAAATEMRRHLNEIERSLDQPVARPVPALRDVFQAYREGP
jgi:DNA-binding GntR family transcriptional regulator